MKNSNMGQLAATLISAIIFGIGLELAQMTNPQKVIGFLNITDKWDPSLMFVMIGAIIVNSILFIVVKRRVAPFFAPKFMLPTLTKADKKLILGSAIFGLGWGIGGFCPGPALSSLMRLQPQIFIVVGSMLLGMWVFKLVEKKF